MSSSTKRALIVVDVQNDFCPGGALAVPHGDEVVAPLNELIKEFLDRDEPVFLSRDWHQEKTKHFAAYGGTWPVHCVMLTDGAAFHPDLIVTNDVRLISKGLGQTDCYSAFDETDLTSRLRKLGVEELWVGGLATDYCVKSTVLDALKEGFRVKALAYAMRAVEVKPGDGERAIEEMRQAGADVINADPAARTNSQSHEDPVIEAYMDGIDRTLLRENLRLSATQRVEALMSLQVFSAELRRAGKRARQR